MPKVDIFPISSNKRPYSKRLHIYVALQTLREKYDYVKGNRAHSFIRPYFIKNIHIQILNLFVRHMFPICNVSGICC